MEGEAGTLWMGICRWEHSETPGAIMRLAAGWVSRRRRHIMVGTTKWFDSKKGFGFIAGEGGPDIFVHYSDIEGDGFRRLSDGERVEFELTQRDRGPAAVNVRRISSESP